MTSFDVKESYRDNDKLRTRFFVFVNTVFPGLDFRIWHDRGCWDDPYIPFSIIENDRIVSNVSITKMKILLNGKQINAIQFGTVGTIPEYRNRGLSRYLMEYVLDKYKNEIDFYFLFANETVLDFYPKFGFKRHNMHIFRSDRGYPDAKTTARKLNLDNQGDFDLVRNTLKNRIPVTQLFGAADYGFITMWHVLNLYPDNLFYFENEQAIVIASEQNDKLHVMDVIASRPVDIDSLIPGVTSNRKLKSVSYYFSPDQLNYRYDDIEPDDDSPLYVLGDIDLGSNPYHFPATAQT